MAVFGAREKAGCSFVREPKCTGSTPGGLFLPKLASPGRMLRGKDCEMLLWCSRRYRTLLPPHRNSLSNLRLAKHGDDPPPPARRCVFSACACCAFRRRPGRGVAGADRQRRGDRDLHQACRPAGPQVRGQDRRGCHVVLGPLDTNRCDLWVSCVMDGYMWVGPRCPRWRKSALTSCCHGGLRVDLSPLSFDSATGILAEWGPAAVSLSHFCALLAVCEGAGLGLALFSSLRAVATLTSLAEKTLGRVRLGFFPEVCASRAFCLA